ncbi:DUF2298 domain-containing protein [Tepidiforma flava]|uniref:DUF2298 domain-containing protein n=1 Tax=Tepidiforma flava TaxID=3004094 RepID=A0ABY7M7U8_9CHLR|nr:DUF2298 domain-containing protein [Tepidiforma flava]WBL36495.1 DUF2298 domain-containing protein [Tepidiforma flava]
MPAPARRSRSPPRAAIGFALGSWPPSRASSSASSAPSTPGLPDRRAHRRRRHRPRRAPRARLSRAPRLDRSRSARARRPRLRRRVRPYNARFETFDPGITRAPATTPLHQFVVQYGVFLALTAAFVALRCREELEARGFDPGRNPVLAVVAGRLEVASLAVFLAGLIAFTWPFGLATLAMSLAALAFLLNLAWLDLRASERDVPRLIATLFLALAVAIAAGVDVVTLKNDIVRMNTVFKFSLQAWHLFALGGGYAGWYAVRGLVERARGRQRRPARLPGSPSPRSPPSSSPPASSSSPAPAAPGGPLRRHAPHAQRFRLFRTRRLHRAPQRRDPGRRRHLPPR